MSRIAKQPVQLPKGVEYQQSGNVVTIKGGNGSLSLDLNSEVEVGQDDGVLSVAPRSRSKFATAMAGTTRALLANMVTGVSDGFERKLELVGVGYRAQAQGKKLNLTLGFSHPVVYDVPERHQHRHAEPDGSGHQGIRQATGWSGCRGNSPFSSARALQGQGCSLRR